ncbi:nuclear transport factor 2 family protein [Sinorhizobium sp. RAC02]|uniref:nuclear transport factor 2 family protein n=1 Tax=Sinorhizobium sp. RAC02 TaxID=1842534 RepID=UPI0008588E8E|nr:nuclear transport factor 2 family protein [Sinorhizobium sp. RAC02]AOF88822.1 snoaL-like domain protein [Sinorhizobium sp. RAC02]
MSNAAAVSVPSPREVAELYLARVGAFWGAPDASERCEAIADLFADDVDWHVAGDPALVPWAGRRRTRESVRAFFPALAQGVEPRRYQVKRILADDTMAVIVGELMSAIRSTGKLVESPFAIELTVLEGRITRYQLHEDSYAVALGTSAG